MIPGLGRCPGKGNGYPLQWGFPGSSAGKESTCNAGNMAWISRSGRSPGEGIDYLFQYSLASLVAQTVKNPPAMQETCVQSMGWEDSLEEGIATHSSTLAWRIPWTEEPGRLQSMGSQSQTQPSNYHFFSGPHVESK